MANVSAYEYGSNPHISEVFGFIQKARTSAVGFSDKQRVLSHLSRDIPSAMQARLSVMKSSLCDTHIHTTYSSDAKFAPDEIFDAALSKGLRTLVLTDHDVIGSLAQDMLSAQRTGIDYSFGGVELKLYYNNDPWHFKVFFDPFNENIFPLVLRVQQANRFINFSKITALCRLEETESIALVNKIRHENMDPVLLREGIPIEEAVEILDWGVNNIRGASPGQLAGLLDHILKHDNIADCLSMPDVGIIDPSSDSRSNDHRVFWLLFGCIPKALYMQGQTPPDHQDVLQSLADNGCFISLAHPARKERESMERYRITKMITDLATKGILMGFETQGNGYSGEMSLYYSHLASQLRSKGLNIIGDAGSDFHGNGLHGKDPFFGLGTGYSGEIKTDYGVFESIRKHITRPILQSAQFHIIAGRYWEALEDYRRASFIDPYNMYLYPAMAKLVLDRF